MNPSHAFPKHPQVADGDGATALTATERPETDFPAAWCLDHPESVTAIHARYREAGARILRTNTWDANPIRMTERGLAEHVNELNWQAAQLAKQAGPGLEIAGRVGPLGGSVAGAAGMDREECFRLQIGALLDGGSTMIWLEGFEDVEELLLAHEVKQSLHHCPAVCSLKITEGRDPAEIVAALARLRDEDAEILGLDGASFPQLLEAVTAWHAAPGVTAGDPPLAVLIPEQPSREAFVSAAQALADAGAGLLGGGPNTSPEDVAALVKAWSDEEE